MRQPREPKQWVTSLLENGEFGMSIFTIDKFCSKDIPSRADYNEIGLELTYSRSGSEDYYFKPNSDTLLAALVGSGARV